MTCTPTERNELRKLAGATAEIAALPVHRERADSWAALNDLKPARPMVSIFQVPWEEMNVDDELTLRCSDPLCRRAEKALRRQLYQWRHFPGDMVVDACYRHAPTITCDSHGIDVEEDTVAQSEDAGVRSHQYHGLIRSEEDVERIQPPYMHLDREKTDGEIAMLSDAIGDLLPVRMRNITTMNFAPWDWLVACWNPQQALMDMVLKPDLVHLAMERTVATYGRVLDKVLADGLLRVEAGNFTVGQGGPGYTSELPQPDYDGEHARTCDVWGGAMAQIFSEVSPEMHEEFALQYEARLMKRFGLTYYGCCEPLHRKVGIVAKHLPNLRKISMSPWVDIGVGAEAIGDRYVFSFKPNPAFLASDAQWDRTSVRSQIEELLEKTKGCAVEIILKDISTVRHEPRRLWEWHDLVMDMIGEGIE